MALHPIFAESPYASLNPTLRWFLADEESFDKYKLTSFRRLVDGVREYKEK